MKNYYNPVFRISLIGGLIVSSLIVITVLFHFPFRLNQDLNGICAITHERHYINSVQEKFVGIDEINQEFSKIFADCEVGNFFKMMPAYDNH